MRNFFRKVGFGISPDEKIPSDPLKWALNQLDEVPPFSWQGNIPTEKELFEKRYLNSTIDVRSIYASAMSTVFDVDFNLIRDKVFWGEKLQNLSDKLFKV